ncbi:hypothetical protein GGS23DRAFT_555042 [Durotheca rogersii]|uniref:uncharacterized protein n=1 Tax=Durotheca rogersii TaxID=419775 RepID=UPI0022204F87|nr:uncharacterized protein GGS23DRAFT_555042 [Durotheca rogersii]KAI5866011.1 hypothetical protein GGS23DRAFT_555042 [Durotheca rogersii]
MSVPSFLYSQLFIEPPVPNHDFTGQTVIITGGNRGIGLEAARHLLHLNAASVILAVRSPEKGKAAASELEASTGRTGVVSVYELDMESHVSVEKFAAEIRALDRVDAVILNAGMYTQFFELADGHERTMTTNVINTFLLAILLVPALKSSARKWNITPRVSFVASDRHVLVNLPEWKTQNTFETLDNKAKTNMNERYYTSKLLQILLARALADALDKQGGDDAGAGRVVVNSLTPGYCVSGLLNDAVGFHGFAFWLLAKAVARTTEVGGRVLVAAITKGKENHGMYLNDGEVQESALSPFVRSTEGSLAQAKVWRELVILLEQTCPGIREIVGTQGSLT